MDTVDLDRVESEGKWDVEQTERKKVKGKKKKRKGREWEERC